MVDLVLGPNLGLGHLFWAKITPGPGLMPRFVPVRRFASHTSEIAQLLTDAEEERGADTFGWKGTSSTGLQRR